MSGLNLHYAFQTPYPFCVPSHTYAYQFGLFDKCFLGTFVSQLQLCLGCSYLYLHVQQDLLPADIISMCQVVCHTQAPKLKLGSSALSLTCSAKDF